MASVKTWRKFTWPLQAQPVVRRAGWYPFQPETQGRLYQHPTAALHQHFYRGTLQYQGGPEIILNPGDVTFTPPQVVTSYFLKTAGYHWCTHFDPLPAGNSESVRIPLHFPLGKSGAYVTERLRDLSRLHTRARQKPRDRLIQCTVAFALQELLLWLILNHRPSPLKIGSRLEAGLDKARALLDENFRNPPEHAEIAAVSGLNRNYLAAHFKRQFGVTLDAYLLRRRLDIACQLLATSNLPIKEVAYESGIPDPQYFNKQFRKGFGMSPSLYRRAHGTPVD